MTSRTGTARTLLWTALLVLSLRPSSRLAPLFDTMLAPVRLAAELATPLRLVGRQRALAAERRLAASAEEELRENLAVLEALGASALPSEPELSRGRRLLLGEVRGRASDGRDRLRVLLRDARGVVEGLPVVLGDAYVGRVVALGPRGEGAERAIEVELVTSRGFRVGARVPRGPGDEAGDVLLAVGGVESEPGRRASERRQLRLVAHNPSDRTLAGGLARVHELLTTPGDPAPLAEGFRLGEVRREGERWTVLPELDYQDGLSHVVVVAPLDPAVAVGAGAQDRGIFDDAWLSVRPLALGDPSPWRETLKIGAGTWRSVREGAAVCAVGARLVGRVARAGPWTSDVSLLGDPGFQVVAVARFEDGEPRMLGRVVSLGRDDAGAVRLRWVPRVESGAAAPGEPPSGEAEERRPARLFTGSGEPGMASGLYLGEALVPLSVRRDEPVELSLETLVAPFEVRTLFVRTEELAFPVGVHEP